MRLLALAFLFCLSALAAGLDTAPLAAWLKNQEGMRTLQADFIQERMLPALKNPLSTPGTLTLARPGKLRWELGKPVKTIVVSDGASFTLLDVENGQRRLLPANSPTVRPYSILGEEAFSHGLEGFLKVFEPLAAQMTGPVYQLTARPVERGMRTRVVHVFFDIDPTVPRLMAFTLELADKSRIRTIFSGEIINAPVPDSRFSLPAPAPAAE